MGSLARLLATSNGAFVLLSSAGISMAHTRSNGLSKRAIFWLPFIGLYAWLAGAVFFDRTDKHDRARARREVLDLVRAGHRLQRRGCSRSRYASRSAACCDPGTMRTPGCSREPAGTR